MATKRTKKTVLSGITREQADAAFAEFAVADAREQKLTAEMDEQITKIREKYQDRLKECAQKKEASFDVVQAYSLENKDVLFVKKKSVETSHGTFGFRTGTPKLKTLKGFTWKAVTELLKIHLPGYVRKVEEPAKDLILAAREDVLVSQFFPEVGICVDQEETFFIECKKEEALS
jgi:phage host-nuclease inhibitor protein Gam